MARWSPNLKRNRAFLIVAGAALVAVSVAAAQLPEWRIWIVVVGLFAVNFAFIAAVAIKSRRILMKVLNALGGEAEAELARQQLELEVDTLYAELYEMRSAIARKNDNDV